MKLSFTVGVDIGKSQDPTAIAVVEHRKPDLHLRHLERLPLGTPYPAVVAHVAALLSRPELAGARLVVDATGVGAPVVDDMREVGLDPVAITITAGKNVKRVAGGWRVPKRVLVGLLVAAVEGRRLKVAKGLRHGETLVRELRDFRVIVTSPGRTAYGGASEHDDLVIAVGLAVWREAETR